MTSREGRRAPRPPRSPAVLRDRGRVVEQRLDDPPRLLDDVPPREQHRPTVERIREQALVRAWALAELLEERDVEGDLARVLRTGRLGEERDRHARVPADAE